MNAAIPPFPTVESAHSWQAHLQLGFERRAERTVLSEVRHRGPLRVQKALYPEGPDVSQVMLLHPPSGIVGGDQLHIHVHVHPHAQAQLTTPGAGKWYRSAAIPAQQNIRFKLEENAVLEWLPQETIVYSGAHAEMNTQVDLASNSRYLGWDIVCLGRTASGERFEHGQLQVNYHIQRDGRRIWLERGLITGNDALLSSPTAWNGASVSGSMLMVLPDLQAAPLLEACRTIAPEDGAQHALTALPQVLIARYLGHNSEAARMWFSRLWAIMRPRFCDREACPPRIWNT